MVAERAAAVEFHAEAEGALSGALKIGRAPAATRMAWGFSVESARDLLIGEKTAQPIVTHSNSAVKRRAG